MPSVIGSPGSIVVFGGGTSMPSSDGKDKAFLSNTTAINADVFLQLKRWTPVLPKPHTSIGLNIGAAYNFGGSGGFGTTPNPFAVTGQTSSMVSDKGTDPAQATFRMGAGPQANFYFGKFIVSPMVLGEYFSMTQKEMSSVQTTQYNGQSYDFTLATLPQTKTSGFAVTPKLRLQYMFNNHFGLFADASYTLGPKIETQLTKLVPNGNPNPQSNSYNIQQLQTGTYVKGETKSTAYSAMGFNFGVVIGLGKLKPPYSPTNPNEEKAVRNKTKSNSANERTANINEEKEWDGNIIIVKHRERDDPYVICYPCCGFDCHMPFKSATTLQENQHIAKTNIKLKGNIITISIESEENEVMLNEDIKHFTAKDLVLLDSYLPTGFYKNQFKRINLDLPQDTIILREKDRKIRLIKDLNNNNAIQCEQKASIVINDKTYLLKVISTISKMIDGTSDKKGWNGKIVDMVVPKTGGNNSNIENITIKGSGEYTNNGIPIVYGRIVKGKIKMTNGVSNSKIAIKISQIESNDIANAVTDENGNFSMELAGDTLHGVSVNNVEYGKIKILDYPINNDKANTDDIKKGWNGKTPLNVNINELQDIKRNITANDKIAFFEVEEIKIYTKSKNNNSPTINYGLTYKIKVDNQGNLYGLPSTFIGIDIPIDSIPNGTFACNPPCSQVGIAGKCGGFCFKLLDVDWGYGPHEFIKFQPENDFPVKSIFEKSNFKNDEFIIQYSGKYLEKQSNLLNNFCSGYIDGYGYIVFQHYFEGSCENAFKILNNIYEKQKK